MVKMKTKYIRHKMTFIVFPESCQHREMAVKAFGVGMLIHGAGFCRLEFKDDQIQADCYGKSESLNKSPRRDDKEQMLSAIGVENDNFVEHAKYVIWRGKAVVFSQTLSHDAVAKAAFLGRTDCDSAGFVKFIKRSDGKIKVQCYGESTSLNVSAKEEDYKLLANLMEIPEQLIFIKQNTHALK